MQYVNRGLRISDQQFLMHQFTIIFVINGKKLQDFKLKKSCLALTDGIFETGAYGVPSKSQNSTVLGQGGFEHWVLDGPYAPVSKIPPVKALIF